MKRSLVLTDGGARKWAATAFGSGKSSSSTQPAKGTAAAATRAAAGGAEQQNQCPKAAGESAFHLRFKRKYLIRPVDPLAASFQILTVLINDWFIIFCIRSHVALTFINLCIFIIEKKRKCLFFLISGYCNYLSAAFCIQQLWR